MSEYELHLPQVDISYPYPLPKKQHLLVIGGRPPAIDWLKEAAKSRILWAVDRGIDICHQADIPPSYLLGDGDSASKTSWEWGASHPIPVDTYPSEKDLTDTQLALEKLPADSFALITGAFGGRFDHTFANIYSCAHSVPCCLADDQELLLFLKDAMTLHIACREMPHAISLLPLTEVCSGVSIEGVHWPLRNALLCQKLPNAVSNIPEKKEFPIALQKGILGVYLHYA